MGTIAVLAAQLQVNGAEEFEAKVTKAGDAVEGLSKKLKPVPGQLETFSRHLQRAKDSASTFDKQGVAVAMRGADAFNGKLSVLNKTAFATPAALGAATKSAGSLKDTLQGVTQAARGFGGALGGLGSLSPVVSAIASPAGLAAAAVGGLAIAVNAVWKEYREFSQRDIRDKLAVDTGAVNAATAGWNAFYDALARGDGMAAADSARLVAESNAAFGENRARALAEIKRLEESNKTLGAMPIAGLSASDIEIVTRKIIDQEEQVRLLRGALVDLASDAGAVAKKAKEHADAEDERAKSLRKAADEAKRFREELEKINELAINTMGGVLGNVAGTMSVGSGKPPKDWKGAGAPGTAMGYGSIMGDIAKTGGDIGQAVADAIIERTASLKNQALGMVPGLAGNMVASAANGPAGIGMALLQASKGFQDTMDRVNGLLQLFADVIGETLRPAIPLLEQITELLRPLAGSLAAIAPLVTELNPAFMLLSVGTRILADTVERVVHVFSQSILGVLRAIRKALHKLGGATWKPLDNAIDSLKKSLKGLDKTSQQLAETFGTILPEGYKLLELRRYQSTPGITTYYGPTGVGTGGGLTAGGNSATSGGVVVQGNIELHGIQDVPSLARALAGERRWRGTVRTGRASYSSGSA